MQNPGGSDGGGKAEAEEKGVAETPSRVVWLVSGWSLADLGPI